MAELHPLVPNVPWSKQTGTSTREKNEQSEMRFCADHEHERVERAIERKGDTPEGY